MVQSTALEHQSRVADALNDLAASHRRLEIMTVNEPGRLRREIVDVLHQAIEDGLEKNEAVLEMLNTRLLALIKDGSTLVKQVEVIDSLLFDTIGERQWRISEAHPGTYSWLFDETNDRGAERTGVSVLEWLRTGSGIYWVSGKAGSGKSTLMKYLHNSGDTLAALHEWAGEKPLVTAAHFFWNAGTDMQKSQQGLLQNLLYHVLRQTPALIPSVCAPSRWNDLSSNLRGSPWPRRKLMDAFSRLGSQSLNSKICFFVDGLDEYEGDHTDVVQILSTFISNDLKVLFSSRPWNVFEKAYGQNFGQKLELQSLTQGDITLFVKDKLFEDKDFQELKARDSRYDELITEITERARGVFLWVFLVVRSLRRGLTNEDTIFELQERLRIIPTDLEEYFQRMLDSVDEIYRKQAARIYLLSLAFEYGITTVTLSYFDEDIPDFALRAPITPWRGEEFSRTCSKTRTRVLAHCKDLLETVPYRGDPTGSALGVEFIHRTVRDFLETGNVKTLLVKRAGKDFDANRHLCNAMLSQIKRLNIHEYDSENLHLFFLLHYSRLELRNRFVDAAIIDELNRTMNSHRSKHSSIKYRAEYPESWLIIEAISLGLYQYVSSHPDKLKLLIEEGCYTGMSPLDFALMYYYGKQPDLRMVRLLLDQGANPNAASDFAGKDKATVWNTFVDAKPRTLESIGILSGEERRQRVEIVEALLAHGADPDIGNKDDYFRNKMSLFATPEEVAYLDDLRLQQRASQQRAFQQPALQQQAPITVLQYLKQWLWW